MLPLLARGIPVTVSGGFGVFWLLGIAGVGDLGGVLRADVLFVGFLRFASPGNPPIFNWAQP